MADEFPREVQEATHWKTSDHKYILHFEDGGQDFLRWLICYGEVVDSDLQSWVWNGTKVLDMPRVGGRIRTKSKPIKGRVINGRILYKIVKIEEVSALLTCTECGAEQPDMGRGVRCETCGGPLDKGVRVSE